MIEPASKAWLSGEQGFWIVAAAISVLVLCANTPLPLLTVYQSAWGFSTAMLTLVYGLYTAGVVVAVFLVGPASDTIGRKRVLLPALALMAGGLICCLVAANVWVLMAGRVLQGLAVGAGVTTAVAALGELHPDPRDHGRIALTTTVATVIGLAGGPLVAGSLAEFAPSPTVVPYLAALTLTAGVLAGTMMVPETVACRKQLKLRPAVIRIPPEVRPAFALATFVEMVAYAVAGTFAGLGASFARDLLHVQNHFAAGLAVAVLFLCSVAAQLLGRRLALRRAMIAGLVIVLAGLALFAYAVQEALAVAFFLSAAIQGMGHGLAYLGSQELTDRIAPADRRAEIFSGFQLGLYAGATLPAIGVGFAARAVGLTDATLIFTAFIALLSVTGLIWISLSRLAVLRS